MLLFKNLKKPFWFVKEFVIYIHLKNTTAKHYKIFFPS